MKTQEIADKLVAHCRQARWETAQRELFADTAVSREPFPPPVGDQETKGLAAIIEKGRKFETLIEQLHSLTVSDPLVAANSFAVAMGMDVTMKGQPRMQMSELCVYEVKDGKIVTEQFHL